MPAIDALKVERDENDQRKEPTISERVALAEAIVEGLGQRKGKRTDLATSGNISPSDQGRTTDLAASKAGLGSGKTLEAAQQVIAKGVPELVQASAVVTNSHQNVISQTALLELVNVPEIFPLRSVQASPALFF